MWLFNHFRGCCYPCILRWHLRTFADALLHSYEQVRLLRAELEDGKRQSRSLMTSTEDDVKRLKSSLIRAEGQRDQFEADLILAQKQVVLVHACTLCMDMRRLVTCLAPALSYAFTLSMSQLTHVATTMTALEKEVEDGSANFLHQRNKLAAVR